MAAAGNVYRHDYEDVAVRFVWRTATADLPQLLAVIERELSISEDGRADIPSTLTLLARADAGEPPMEGDEI